MGKKISSNQSQIADNLFSNLDDETIQRIAMASLPGAMALRQVSKRFYSLFSTNQTLSSHITTKPDIFRKLLGHVALGELGDAEKIWCDHPDLLTCYGTVFHPNRVYEGDNVVEILFHHNPGRYKYTQKTVLQILWMNEEYEAAKLIEDRLSPDEVRRQFVEVFPDGVIKKDNFALEKANELLRAVFDAIIKDGSINANNLDVMNAKTKKALDALYAYAKPTSEPNTGLVFDVNFYLAALNLYDTNACKFKQKCGKYDFWCIRVEEWLAGCLGTGYFRPHAQGLDKQENRLIGCKLADQTWGFAFRRDSSSVPGLDLFVGHFGTAGVWVDGLARAAPAGRRGRGRRAAARVRGYGFGELCRAKNNAAIDLCERATQTLKQNRIT